MLALHGGSVDLDDVWPMLVGGASCGSSGLIRSSPPSNVDREQSPGMPRRHFKQGPCSYLGLTNEDTLPRQRRRPGRGLRSLTGRYAPKRRQQQDRGKFQSWTQYGRVWTSRRQKRGSHTTKIGGIIETILEIKADDPSAKALVFSSWLVVIDVLKKALEANEVAYIALKPGPNFKNNLALFRHDPSIVVLLLPLSMGAKGLNLTEATHVLLVEPILNLGDELQAIGRVHRIGQTRKTYVHHFMVKNTIEERIVDFLRSSQMSRSCLEDHAKMTIDDLKNLLFK